MYLAATSRSTSEICRHFRLSPKAQTLAALDLTPWRFYAALRKQELHADAIRFMARALPKRMSIWWGLLVAWDIYRPECDALADAALEAAIAWVQDPSEDHRQAARQPGWAATPRSPAGLLALAAHWSGGSMSRPALPIVPPPLFLSGRLVGGAVLLCSVIREPMKYRDQYHRYLDLADRVARRELLWFEANAEPSHEPLTAAASEVEVATAETEFDAASQPHAVPQHA